MAAIFHTYIESPVGKLLLECSEEKLCAIHFVEKEDTSSEIIPDILKKTEKQLQEYFSGERFLFDLELDPKGSDFQKKAWDLVLNVPFGETTTYGEIAKKLGSATYTRAVGMANAKNPIPIIIPCHRILGTNGKLTGYAGGLERKKQLLLHEMKFRKTGILF